MKVEVCHPTELGQVELDRWREIQHADPALGSPFLSPEFTVAVGSLWPLARVGVLLDGGVIMGFFPFERGRLGHGTPIGRGRSNAQGVIGAAGLDWEPRELLRACGLALWEFDHLVEGQKPFEPFATARFAAPFVDLEDGFEPFLRHLRTHKSRFSGLSRKRRKIAREVGEERFVFDSRDHRDLHTVLKWKSNQYRRTGWEDRFASGWNVELLELLLDTRTDTFSGALSVLYAGDELVAGHFGLRSKHVLAQWFPAYDTRFGAYQPGLITNLALVEAAQEAGIHRVEMGPGDEDYKKWFCNREAAISRGRVVVPSARGGLQRIRLASVDWVYRGLDRLSPENRSLRRRLNRVRTGFGRAGAKLSRRNTTRL